MGLFSKKAVQLFAPASGQFKHISEVSDPVFAEKMMGDGYAVVPSSPEIFAPVEGTITNIFPTKHAIGIETKKGIEVLVHMGIDTVDLNGAPFEVFVKVGDKVNSSTQLATIDLALLEKEGKDKDVMIIFTNGDKFKALDLTASGNVTASDVVGEIQN